MFQNILIGVLVGGAVVGGVTYGVMQKRNADLVATADPLLVQSLSKTNEQSESKNNQSSDNSPVASNQPDSSNVTSPSSQGSSTQPASITPAPVSADLVAWNNQECVRVANLSPLATVSFPFTIKGTLANNSCLPIFEGEAGAVYFEVAGKKISTSNYVAIAKVLEYYYDNSQAPIDFEVTLQGVGASYSGPALLVFESYRGGDSTPVVPVKYKMPVMLP